MLKAKPGDVISWEDSKLKITRMGIVRKLLENSVIVDISNAYDATVVSHKRYEIVSRNNECVAHK